MRQIHPEKQCVDKWSDNVPSAVRQAIMHSRATELETEVFAVPSLQLVVDFLRPVVVRRVRRALNSSGVEAELEDLVQDVFVWLLSDECRVLRLWAPEKGLSLRNFVGMVCERRIRSKLRSSSRASVLMLEQEADSAVECSDPESQAITQSELRLLFASLETALTPLGMRVFQLIYINEESVDTVSETLAMSADAVYAWRKRLRTTLESLMRELHDPA